MPSIATYLKELAVGLGHQQQCMAEQAKKSLPKARRRLAEIQEHRQAILSAAEGDSADSPLHDIARQVDRDLAQAMAEVSSLELENDAAAAAMQRAREYLPITAGGSYACPRCWVGEHMRTGLESIFKASAVEIYKCPICSYRFATDYAYRPEGVVPRSQNQSI